VLENRRVLQFILLPEKRKGKFIFMHVIFEVLRSVYLKNAIFWYVTAGVDSETEYLIQLTIWKHTSGFTQLANTFNCNQITSIPHFTAYLPIDLTETRSSVHLADSHCSFHFFLPLTLNFASLLKRNCTFLRVLR
jgi:hypothetical protein